MTTQQINFKPSRFSRHKWWLALALPMAAVFGVANSLNDSPIIRTIELNLPESSAISDFLDPQDEEFHIPPTFEYVIKTGDSLSQIFDQLGFGYQEMMKVMETDLNYLALDTLKPGNTLRFWRSMETGALDRMELEFNIADKVVYALNSDGSYDFEDISVPGEWRQDPLVGKINGSFSVSANKLGLNGIEIEQIVALLKEKVNFARDLRAGDKFEIVRRTHLVDGVESGKSQIEAIKLFNRGRVLSAYLHSDGQYYDAKGESLQRAFQRYPVSRKWRLSSHFNPRRLHPVTGRVTPHNGTDFATPVGTPVVSTGDGTVILTRKHPFAGNYVVVQHSSKYKTRYLHLNKILVRKGQKVSRGQKIGLSGRSGRVTGPHLHYELLVNGRPVDAMKAKIPMASSVAKKERKAFIAKRDKLDKMLKEKEATLTQ